MKKEERKIQNEKGREKRRREHDTQYNGKGRSLIEVIQYKRKEERKEMTECYALYDQRDSCCSKRHPLIVVPSVRTISFM
jgi:hypothetical protein